MALRLGGRTNGRTRIAAKKCPTCSAGDLEDLRAGQQAVTSVIQQQRLKALKKARRVKKAKAKKGVA